jgi:hypothetical protein
MEQATLVRVTSDHIARGKPRNCGECPVALALIGALGDLIPEGSVVEVTRTTAVVDLPGGEAWEAILPAVARDFIAAFDDETLGGTYAPVEFALAWRLDEWWRP